MNDKNYYTCFLNQSSLGIDIQEGSQCDGDDTVEYTINNPQGLSGGGSAGLASGKLSMDMHFGSDTDGWGVEYQRAENGDERVEFQALDGSGSVYLKDGRVDEIVVTSAGRQWRISDCSSASWVVDVSDVE